MKVAPLFRVPQYRDEDLTRLAIRHYNEALRQRGPWIPSMIARCDSDQAFLDRLRVNYLRHQVSDRVCPLGAMLPGETYREVQCAIRTW